MSETRTVHDPFIGIDVEVSDKLVDRLRGKYAIGPHLPNGNPEFGWRQFQAPPIQHEAADKIEALEAEITRFRTELETARSEEREACAALISTGAFCRHVEHVQEYCDCRAMAAAIRARAPLPPADGGAE